MGQGLWCASVVTLAALAGGCQIVIPPTDKETIAKVRAVETREAELQRAASWLLGSFSTRQQAMTGRQFADLRLHSAPIWPRRKDGVWIYLEQAPPGDLTHPIRQRILRVRLQDNGLLVCDVFALPDPPQRFAESWKDDARLDAITPHDLPFLEGCQLVLKPVGDSAYEGGTVGSGCSSERPGTANETAELRLTPDGLSLWERGFDKSGKQLWGGTAGPLQFLRTAE